MKLLCPNLLKNQNKIVEKVQQTLDGPKLIIRSSSLSEDTESESKAGLFKTVSNIDIKDITEIIEENLEN